MATSFHMCLGRKISYITFLTHQNKVFVILNPYLLKTQNLGGPIAKFKDEMLSSNNRESGKFWTSIPLPVSSPSSSLSPFLFPLKELSIFAKFTSSYPQPLSVQCTLFRLCSYLSAKTVFSQYHQWPPCYRRQCSNFNPYLTWYSSMKHNWLLPTPWSIIFSCLPVLHTPSCPSLTGSSFSRFLFFLTSCSMTQSLNLISYLSL